MGRKTGRFSPEMIQIFGKTALFGTNSYPNSLNSGRNNSSCRGVCYIFSLLKRFIFIILFLLANLNNT